MVTDSKKGLSIQAAAGTLLAGSLALASGMTHADGNPFASADLPGGYMLGEADNGNKAKHDEGRRSEGKCGSKTVGEAVCGIYQIGSSHKDPSKVKDGKCGGHKVVEALCGGGRE